MVEVDWGTPLHNLAQRALPGDNPSAFLVGGYGGMWDTPTHFATPYAPLTLGAIGVATGVGVMVVLGAAACGLAESARIATSGRREL